MKKSFLIAAACVLALSVSSIHAAIITTYSATSGPTDTPWGVTGSPFNQAAVTLNLPEFDQSQFAFWELEEVCITLDGIAETEISLTAITDTYVNGGAVGANISAFNFSTGPSSLTLNALPNGTLAPFSLPAGTTTPMTVITGSDTDSLSITGVDLANYIGTGMFSVDVSALGTSTLNILGGNASAQQLTEGAATITVTYKGTYVPEPSGLAMFPMIALGLITAIRRRRK